MELHAIEVIRLYLDVFDPKDYFSVQESGRLNEDGIITQFIRKENKENNSKWLVFDSVFHNEVWCNLNQGKVTLKCGEQLEISGNIKFIQETLNVDNASPAVLSQASTFTISINGFSFSQFMSTQNQRLTKVASTTDTHTIASVLSACF